jgi:ABC-type lipoprotein export system ATPase subunit
MEEGRIEEILARTPLKTLLSRYPYIENIFEGTRIQILDGGQTVVEFLAGCPEEYFTDYGFTKSLFAEALTGLIDRLDRIETGGGPVLESLTILGGKDKDGGREDKSLSLRRGEIVSVVGPTGAGKTRLLEDIECLAQGDTPTGRRILLDNRFPGEEERWRLEQRMVAQLSQNMNFVVDLPVYEFLKIHAECRTGGGGPGVEKTIAEIMTCANSLAGEGFAPSTPVTRLSGGQSRALMIADTALLSDSPIILIDEIENAGIDRRRALELLAKQDKMILLSTHDPALALMGSRRVVIQNGAMAEILERTEAEEKNLAFLEELDLYFLDLRDSIRKGRRIEYNLRGAIPGGEKHE